MTKQVSPEEVRVDVRPIATRFVKQISLYCNNRYADGARMTVVVACAILERIMMSVTKSAHPMNKEEGRKFIETLYDGAKKDALQEWEMQ